jgi:hypothetical protein
MSSVGKASSSVAPPAAEQPLEHAGSNGTSPGHDKRLLRVVVPRGADDDACVRVLQQLHLLVDRSPGADAMLLILHDRSGGRIELAGADILVQHSSELESQVRTLVGDENLDVLSATRS